MASTRYTDKLGVSEKAAPYEHSLRLIGKQDENGRTIGISYFTSTALRLVPFAIRTLFLLVILAFPLIRTPFGWLPAGPDAPDFVVDLATWSLFSWGTWIAAIALYLVYYGVSLVKDSIYPGLPGAEIHFARHKKIVRTVKPGERAIILDFRVKPYAVVSTKPIALEMPEVEGNTRDNISLTFRGALILRTKDTYRLLAQGGFEKFNQQLTKTYESMVKDAIIGIDAKDFNRFMIEEVRSSAVEKENVSKKLEQLGKTDLTLGFLSDLTEIDEVDVASFDLTESTAPRRREILDRLRRLGETYGIEVMDHLPLGNTTSEAYLKSLARPLANSITRLEQSTDTLREITEEEISEEIIANVADKEIGVLEIRKIIKEIESITATLRDRSNAESIVRAKEVAMENAQQSVLVPRISAIESLMAQVQAKVIDTAGLERYMRESQELLDGLERDLDRLVPEIDKVIVESLDAKGIVPDIDVLESMLETSGTNTAFASLKKQLEQRADYGSLEGELSAIEGKSAAMHVEESMQEVEQALAQITADSGISARDYSPEAVSRKIDRIAAQADLEMGTDDAPQAEGRA